MRQESSTCSEMVLFPDCNQSTKLPKREEVLIEFTPGKSGEYGFQCQMGVVRGKRIVE
jgi:plastocyanin domain-containing protein